MAYGVHLQNLNREKRNEEGDDDDDDYLTHNNKHCAICPIAQSEIDARDPASTISVISSTTTLGPDDRALIGAMGFIIPPDKEITCHHADSYALDAANEWFVNKQGTHPLTRRVLTTDERDRIKFRADMQNFIKLEVSEKDIREMFTQYTEELATNTVCVNSDTFVMLRCHLAPEMLPNFFKFTREEAQDYLQKSKTDGKNISWVARPSKFKGYEFAKDGNSRFYPMVEYTVITSFDSVTGNFRNDLMEKVFSRGYYRSSGSWNGDAFNLERSRGAPCFFDLLHNILKQIHKDSCDVRMFHISSVIPDADDIKDQ